MDPVKQSQDLREQENRLIDRIHPLLSSLGYEVVDLEIHHHGRQKKIRVFIDLRDPSAGRHVGIEDCVNATRALDEPLDRLIEGDGIFKGSYDLEVSSPGLNRPLRVARDFARFAGEEARMVTFRPLTAEECGNAAHLEKNPRQKTFHGRIHGVEGDRVRLRLDGGSGKSARRQAEAGATGAPGGNDVTIPLGLVSRAQLEPCLTPPGGRPKPARQSVGETRE